MRVTINGQVQDVAGTTMAELVAAMKLDPTRIAVERNRQLVTRRAYDQTQLADGDEIEIVTLVGGG